ncbi:hypothetical protein SB5439_05130 [Klebsiella variicola]|nr:hypothetical protein SB5439_05130 [Klebsiella variicola]
MANKKPRNLSKATGFFTLCRVENATLRHRLNYLINPKLNQ